MAGRIIAEECSICEYTLNTNDNIVITEFGHVSHRLCALQRLNEKQKSHYRNCGKKWAVSDAPQKYQRSLCNVLENAEDYDESYILNNAEKYEKLTSDALNRCSGNHDGTIGNWVRASCSMANTRLTHRCESCGKAQQKCSGTFPEILLQQDDASIHNWKLIYKGD